MASLPSLALALSLTPAASLPYLSLALLISHSVAALSGSDAARVAADPSGSRVAEALLEGSAPVKVGGVMTTL